ncbi:MAG: HD domain-containing phosphohydrolase [Pseudomonadota bacterium]
MGRKVAFGVPGRLAADIVEGVRRLAEASPEESPQRSAQVVADVRLSDLAETILEIVALRSPVTAAHSRRVSTLTLRLGTSQELEPAELEILAAAALLHDVGKLAMPAHLLDKPAQLTRTEARIMRGHTEIGARLLYGTPILDRIGRIVGEHHEKRDGSGYPKGLTAAAQDPLTAIVTVADVYDALTGRRAYKGEMSGQEARTLMRRDMSAALAPDLLTALDRLSAE